MRTVLGPPVIPLKPEERPSQDFDLSTVSMTHNEGNLNVYT